MTDPRIEQSLAEMIARWHDPEFWKEQGCRMDSGDCANELETWHARAMKLCERWTEQADTIPFAADKRTAAKELRELLGDLK